MDIYFQKRGFNWKLNLFHKPFFIGAQIKPKTEVKRPVNTVTLNIKVNKERENDANLFN